MRVELRIDDGVLVAQGRTEDLRPSLIDDFDSWLVLIPVDGFEELTIRQSSRLELRLVDV